MPDFNEIPVFNPYHWFWVDDTGRVFSSKAGAIIDPQDEDYAAWTAAGLRPTVWPRDDAGKQADAALQAVLTAYGLTIKS